jgi:hypothetical protein
MTSNELTQLACEIMREINYAPAWAKTNILAKELQKLYENARNETIATLKQPPV